MPVRLLSIVALIFKITCARVTFPYSQVLQFSDIDWNKPAPFDCDDGCKVYVDRNSVYMAIYQDENIVALFSDVAVTGKGLELPPGPNYRLQYVTYSSYDFVFYVVSRNAPNYDSPVFVFKEATENIITEPSDRYLTVISSFNELTYAHMGGTFPIGYPRIYTTGYDAIGDTTSCEPVYQARSQSNAENSKPTVIAPIVTLDFGYVGQHHVTIIPRDDKNPPQKTALSSTVYMSPGYFGCPLYGAQVYSSNVANKEVADTFTLVADSLDIIATSNAVHLEEAIHLRVNQEILDFSSTSYFNFTKHYDAGTFNVELSWNRSTPTSSWSMQLDFVTEQSTTTTTTIATSTKSLEPTTSIGLVHSIGTLSMATVVTVIALCY